MIKYITHTRVDITVEQEGTRYKIPFMVLSEAFPDQDYQISKVIIGWWDWDRKTILDFIETYIKPVIEEMQAYILY